MNSSQNKYDSIENLIFNEGLRITSVDFSNSFDKMFVHLTNNVSFVIPIKLFDSLQKANPNTLRNFKLVAGKTGIYWPDLNEDLSLKGFFKDYLKQKIYSEKELVLS
jgi:hypothetical protein